MKYCEMNRVFFFWIGFIILLNLYACSGTRRLSSDEVLFTATRQVKFNRIPDAGEDWKLHHKTDKKIDAWLSVYVAPNGALLGLPFFRLLSIRLFFYNLFYTDKEKGFTHWMMNNFGEPPVTIQSVNPSLRVKKIENDLANLGHFGVEGGYKVIPKRGNKQKARIRYFFNIPKAYTYRSKEVVLDSAQQNLEAAFNSYLERSLIRSGDDFNLENISLEKERLWQHLQNLGYYYLNQDHILLLADTTVGDKQLDLQYRLDTSLPESTYQTVTITDRAIKTDSALVKLDEEMRSKVRVKSKVLNKAITIPEGDTYSLEGTRKSMRNLSSLGVFTDMSVEYEIDKNDSSKAAAVVNLHPQDEVVLSLNGDLALKNTGFIGPSLGVELNHKNIFGGAENLTLGVSGYLDFPMGAFRDRVSTSSGYAVDAKLSFPVLNSALGFVTRNAITLPRRNISFSFEQNNRVDYFRIASWKASYGLSWMSSPRVAHRLRLLNVNYSHLLSTTAVFDSLIQESSQVAESFQDQFIIGPSYTFTYDNTNTPNKKLTSLYQAEIEFSGNILSGMYGLLGEEENGERRLLGVQYSQYIRFMSDFRLYYKLAGRRSLAFRNIFQIGKAYGNSNYLPFVKQFFVGGSNSLRPIDARTAGPGRYIELESAVVNQVGDIRIETNLEYRFHLFYKLNGAIWADYGNIWLHEDDPDRPYSGIHWGEIFEDSYLTAGVGARLDFGYFVARLDYGAVLYAPFFIDGYKWLWQHNFSLWGPMIGIGYPF